MSETDLSHHIQSLPLIDTHEHLRNEQTYLDQPQDVLSLLFGNYVTGDLQAAGASGEAVQRLQDASDPDIEGRFGEVRDAWECCRHTGYGRAVSIQAARFFGIQTISSQPLMQAQSRVTDYHQPGARLRILRDDANLEHVQTDDFTVGCRPDPSGPDFFLYDLSWHAFAKGEVDPAQLYRETGIEIRGVESLREALAATFARSGPLAIAVKSQHAYSRTLRWQPRGDDDVAPLLEALLAGQELDADQQLILGDWCLARGVEQAIRYNLPIKIHTGYYAGNNRMVCDRIHPGHLAPLLAAYPEERFVLMHIGYPYDSEMIAVAKHFTNVWVDLCWAWSIDPLSSRRFVQAYLHAAPSNKLFAFGGDTRTPTSAAAYSFQARDEMTRALQACIDDGDLTEPDAIRLATRFMQDNQRACFDIEGTRDAIRAAMAAEPNTA